MNLSSISIALQQRFPKEEPDCHIVEITEGFLSVNGYCLMPIKLPVHYDRSLSVTVFDEIGTELGDILFIDKSNAIDINSLTELNFYCLVNELNTDEIIESQYKFLHDYIVLKKEHIVRYINDYKTKAPIWGGFFHIDDLPNNTFNRTHNVDSLSAIKDLVIDRPFYLESLELIVNETNPFNRFLKLYHLIEMQFDVHTAIKLSSFLAQGNKEREISRTLKDYNREDIERLKSLFLSKLDRQSIIIFLDRIIPFKRTADSIFYEYGKDSNPIKSKIHFDTIVGLGSFNENNINNTIGNNKFNEIVPKIIAYWLYRVRSSIAHNKLGEYLMTVNDEEFILEFAEPLIRQVIIQCYKQ